MTTTTVLTSRYKERTMTATEIINQYIVPNIPAIVACASTIATYFKCAGGAKQIIGKVSNKVDELKQAKMLEELVAQNKILIEDNAKLRKQLNQVIELGTKVRCNEEN